MAGGGLPSRPEGKKAEGFKGGSARPTWVMPEPSPEVVEDLRRRFPMVVQLPEEVTRSGSDLWLAKGVVAKSLGRRVAVEAVVREIQLRGSLVGEVQGFPMDGKFFALRFSEMEDRDRVLRQPWVVNGQVLAVERWKPRFIPTGNAIQSAVVWVRLPLLPVEYWVEEAVRSIVKPAGELVCLDDCTVNQRRLGFARAAIRISLARPLRPGVIIGDPEGGWWQRFVYEQLDGICFSCGTFHDVEGVCPATEKGGPSKIQSVNVTGETVEEGDGAVGRQELGPWITAVRRWLPAERKEKPQSKVDQTQGGQPGISRRNVEVERGKKPMVFGAVPDGGQAAEGWMKPSKVARRRSPPRGPATETEDVQDAVPNPFALLPVDGEMTEARVVVAHTKRARSPVRSHGVMKGGKKAQPKALARLMGQPTGSENGAFHFSAGVPTLGSSSSISGDPSPPGPAPMEELPVMSHDEAVGRLSQALQEEGEGIVDMGNLIDEESGGYGGGHRVEDPSTSSIIHD